MAKTADYRLGEFTFPRGWFMIAQSHELTHKPLALHFLGRDFALYRGMASGKVVLLDAYCPHMQTHLGAHNTTSYVVLDNNGTNIVGDDIVCPYHGWKFGVDGGCLDMPTEPAGSRMLQGVKARGYPARLAGPVLWIYMGDARPVPELPGFGFVGLPDEQCGKIIAAFIKLRAEVSECDLDAHCIASGLAKFKRPRRYQFIDQIPKSPVGKVLRRVLLAQFQEQALKAIS